MRKLLTAILLFVPVSIYSQISGVVMDKSSGYPVRHASIRVEGWNAVTMADFRGCFTFSEDFLNKTLVISAIGFIPEQIVAVREFMRIELKTIVYRMVEVSITPEKKRAEPVIDRYGKDSVKDWYCSNTGQWMVARSQMDSLRSGPCLGIFPDRKVRPDIIY